jgi:hypothetical protein
VSIFGRILTDDQVEDAVLATLKRWVGTEMSEVERQLGLTVPHYQRPQSWEVHTDFDSFPEEQLPRIIVVSQGIADQPVKSGQGVLRATYQIGVANVVSSTDQVKSRRWAYRLAAAVGATLAHRRSLDGTLVGVRGTDLIDRRNGEVPFDGDRTLWMVRQTFAIEVDDFLTMSAGPASPAADPPVPDTDPVPDWPIVGDGQSGHTITPADPEVF